MARLGIAAGGAIIGFLIGGPAGASLGWTLGTLIGTLLFPPDPIRGPRLEDLSVQVSSYGVPIPRLYGWNRVSGNVIWATDIVETKKKKTAKGGPTTVTYKYYANFTVAVCEGVATPFRIWGDSKLIWGMNTVTGEITTEYPDVISYQRGTENDQPSPLHERYDGVGNVPAYRDVLKIDFDLLPLKDFGNHIPNISIEVFGGAILGECIHPWLTIPDTLDWTSLNLGPSRFAYVPGSSYYPYVWYSNFLIAVDNVNRRGFIYVYMGFEDAGPLQDYENMVGYTYSTDPWWHSDYITVFDLDTKAEIGHHDLTGKLNDWVQAIDPTAYIQQIFYITPLESSNLVVLNGQGYTATSLSRQITFFVVYDLDTDTIVGDSGFVNMSTSGYNSGWDFNPPIRVTEGGVTRWYVMYGYQNVGGTVNKWHLWQVDESGTVSVCVMAGTEPVTGFRYPVVGTVNEGSTDVYVSTYQSPLDGAVYRVVFPFTYTGSFSTSLVFRPGTVISIGDVYYDPTTKYVVTFYVLGGNRHLAASDTANSDILVYDTSGVPGSYFIKINYTGTAGTVIATPGKVLMYKFGDSGQAVVVDCLTGAGVDWASTNPSGWDGSEFYPNFFDDISCSVISINYYSNGFYGLIPTPENNYCMLPLEYKTMATEGTFATTVKLKDIVRDICERCQMTNIVDFDVNNLTDDVMGYALTRQASGRQAIEPLQQVYLFDGIETQGKLTWKYRDNPVVKTIVEKDLGAKPFSGARVDRLVDVRQQELELPFRVTVRYADPERNYQSGSQYFMRNRNAQYSDQVLSVDVPMTLQPDDAKQVARRILYIAWQYRTSYEFQLPRSYIELDPGDIVEIPLNGTLSEVYITSIDYGADGLLKLQGQSHDELVYLDTGDLGTSVIIEPDDVGVRSPMVVEFIDGPLVIDYQDDYSGFVIAAEGTDQDPTHSWPGGVLYRSVTGTIYEELAIVYEESIIGDSLTILTDQPHTLLDRINVLRVQIDRGTLASTDFRSFMNGSNIFMLGEELCAFMIATQVSAGVYDLSILRRGLQGSSWATGTHTTYGERFIFLDITTNVGVIINPSEVGIERNYKALTFGYSLDEVTAVQFTPYNIHFKPIQPSHLRGVRDGSDNLTITWIRCARKDHEWKDITDSPLDEPIERYILKVYDGAVIVREETIDNVSIYVYTAANQTTDFGSPQAAIDIQVCQYSTRVGNGYFVSRTL